MTIKKTCNQCALHKLPSEFSKCKSSKDGLQNKCKTCSKLASRLHYEKNYDLEREKKAEWYQRNREHVLNKSKQWNYSNRARINARKYKRYHSDINFKLADILRSRITKFLKRGSAFDALGCTLEELQIHLESQFKPGMSWNNWSRDGWHIDHVLPLSKFDLTNPVQFNKAVHYTNLQPLWAAENLSKKDKI